MPDRRNEAYLTMSVMGDNEQLEISETGDGDLPSHAACGTDKPMRDTGHGEAAVPNTDEEEEEEEELAGLSAHDGLHIYLPCVDADGAVPVETAAALFCLLCADVPLHWLRLVVCGRPTADTEPTVQVRLPCAAVAEDQVPAAVAACRLPAAHLPAERLCVAGLCAVVRRAVRAVYLLRRPDATHYTDRDTSLLGFRRGTLAPPADASLWTRFCERDVPAAVRRVLAAVGVIPSGEAEPAAARCRLDVPPQLLQFEHHMRQPLRVHNVWKQEQACGGRRTRWSSGDHKTALQCVRHTYAEGHILTISDLLLYPCLRLLTEALVPHGFLLEHVAPATHSWMQAVQGRAGVLATWHDTFPTAPPQPPHASRLTLNIADVPPESLYKKDPARYKPKKRQFTVQSDVAAALERLEAAGFASRVAAHPGSGRLRLDWAAMPAAACPADGGLPAVRLRRKQHQLENLAWLAVHAARPGDTIVDFCSGGGHVGLLLAVLLPDCQVVLVENKEESLRRAQLRAATLALDNVSLYQCNMEFYRGDFQLGVALHACGVATDLVMERCLAAGAALLCCPCCYGAVHEFGDVTYPRSAAGRRTGAPPRDWLVLGHAADQTHGDQSAKSEQGRRCMAYVDSDRAAYMAEAGYRTLLTVAEPADCSNKNHLLVALPPGWAGDDSFLVARLAPTAS